MAPGLPLPKASATATPTPSPGDEADLPPPSDPPLFIYVATALGVFLLALLLYYLRHRRRSSSSSTKSAKPPRVPSPHLAATEPYRPDPESTPPVPPIPRRFLRESSVILETHATHHAVDLLETQARAKRKSSRPADRKADFRDNYNGPPGPLLIREDRDAVLQAATLRATMSAAQREEEERKKADKKKKKRAAAASSAMPMSATTMAPGMEMMAERQAQAEAKIKAYQERLDRHEARQQRAKMASSKALEPITPLLVREPPERLPSASLSAEIAEVIRNGPANKTAEAPLSPTPSSSSTVLSTMSGPSGALPLPASPLSPASLDDDRTSTEPWSVPLPASPLSPTSLDSGVIVETTGSGGPLSPITEEEPAMLPISAVATSKNTTLLVPTQVETSPTPDSATGPSPALSPHSPPDSASSSASPSPQAPPPRTLDSIPPLPPFPSSAAAATATPRRTRASTLAKAGRAVHSMDAILFHKVSSQATLDPSPLTLADPAAPAPPTPTLRRRGSLDGLPAPAPAPVTLAVPPAASAPTSPTPAPAPASPPAADRGHPLLARGRGRGRGAPTSTRRASRFLERIASSGTIITPASLASSTSSPRASPKSPLARHTTALAASAGPDMSPARTTLVPGGTYVAIAAYLARKRDEVSVMRGDLVLVERVLSDGWCVGVNRDLEGVRGVFPLYVVEEVEVGSG